MSLPVIRLGGHQPFHRRVERTLTIFRQEIGSDQIQRVKRLSEHESELGTHFENAAPVVDQFAQGAPTLIIG